MSNSLQQLEVSLVHVQAAYQKIVERVQKAIENSEPLDKLERDLVTQVMNLGHACLQDFIDAAGDGDIGQQLTIDGQVVRRSQEKHKRTPRDVLDGQSQVAIANKRLWAEMNVISDEEVSSGVHRVFESLAAEHAQRDPDGKKTLICLMDGDRHLWSLQQKYLPAAIAVLDLFHGMEYLWLAAHCFHREASVEAESWVSHHLKRLLENKVDSVRGLLQRAINHNSLSSTKLEHLERVYNYFTTNRERMRYGNYLAAGYPIGSGVIEGACKHVIGDRMCCTGMRWEFEGAQPMIDLRVTKLNNEWEDFIDYRIRTEQAQLYNTPL